MNGLNVEGIVSNVTYIILMILGDGELVEIRGVGSPSVERCGEGDVVVVRMMTPNITKAHEEHAIFEDVMPLEDIREPLCKEDMVNQEESQGSRSKDIEEGPKDSGRKEEQNLQNLEEIEEYESGNEEDSQDKEPREEAGSGGSSCDNSKTMILMSQKRKRRNFQIPSLSEDEKEEEIPKKRRIEEI